MLNNKKVLITNDDGIEAEGIKALVKEIYQYTHHIIVVAPLKNASAISHARTIRKGMKLEKVENFYEDVEAYALDGTPGDCVRFAYLKISNQFDYVISGINNGLNLGEDILFSGTCAAAFEASLLHIKAIAFSTEVGHFENNKYIKDVLNYIEENNLTRFEILNVNIPLNPKGIRQTIQSKLQIFNDGFKEIDGLWYLDGGRIDYSQHEDDDTDLISHINGYISITPLTTDRTKYE